MALQLRQARVTDLPAIYRGEESYIRCWEPEHEASWRAQLGRHLTRWVENFDRLNVAFMGNAFAGYSLWIPEQSYAELCTIHVSPEHRRSGVGMALLEAYALDAARHGFTQLRLSVRPDNPAKRMYEKAGFLCTGTGAHDYLTYKRHARGGRCGSASGR
ncbi:MAG: N-acetyltransferase [Pseudomonas sp.]|nr:N-acetyltransferase [Pseudomonas sp.]MDO4235889.1 N-acetyltransferase [Pseudomonas sp.]